MTIVRVPWSSASFVLYVGGFTVLASLAGLLETLNNDWQKAAFVGWSLLVLAVVTILALGVQLAGRRVAGGVLGLSSTVAAIVFVAALENWFGWLNNRGPGPFGGFSFGYSLLELLVVIIALLGILLYHLPLLAFVASVGAWLFVTDLISNGGTWSAWVTLVVGLVLVVVALLADPTYGFWVHLAAGLLVGGVLLDWFHGGSVRIVVLGVLALVFIAVGNALGRSAYAVLGIVGLFVTATHFISDWFGSVVLVPPIFGVGIGGPSSSSGSAVGRAIAYAAFGFLLMALAVILARRRGDDPGAAS